ncbi:TniB family NTP-binding protein [Sphingomonas sp. SAFR-052]|uniref:TniB family NTP-binding protein n=1 Tax=Sphingomonas sp. SAFR-052 TaxID=3436867 RepID=UPI003F7D167A
MDGNRTQFVADDFLPKTGNPWPDDGLSMLAAEATMLGTFDGIYIFNPRHLPVFTSVEQLRLLGLAQPGGRKRALRILAPSGSGKTTTIKQYAQKVAARLTDAERSWRRPVVILSIHPKIKVKGWWLAVLSALGEEMYRPRDTEETVRRRAYEAIVRFGVEVLVIDESQHLAVGTKMIGEVTDRLKRFLDDGIVPVVLMGTSDARTMLESNLQLSNRMIPPADIVPFAANDDKDRAELRGFLKRFDAAMVANGIMKEPAGLDDLLVSACLMQISSGVLGRIVNLLRVAVGRAYRRGARRIELCDLQAATASWAVRQAMVVENPFKSAGDEQ